MGVGAYNVLPGKGENYLQMTIEPVGPAIPVPTGQAALRAEVKHALQVLASLPVLDANRVNEYARALFVIAQQGLTGEAPQTELAQRDLIELRNCIARIEGQVLKNRQAACMLWTAIINAAIALAIVAWGRPEAYLGKRLVAFGASDFDLTIVRSFAFLWVGTMGGAWLSFVWRNPSIPFNELGHVRIGMGNAWIRLLFTGGLTLIAGALMHFQTLAFKMALLDTAEVGQRPLTALVIGALCGFSEQKLPMIIAAKAGQVGGSKDEDETKTPQEKAPGASGSSLLSRGADFFKDATEWMRFKGPGSGRRATDLNSDKPAPTDKDTNA
jgi:hypothetical protein